MITTKKNAETLLTYFLVQETSIHQPGRPTSKEAPGPLLSHLVEKIADGAPAQSLAEHNEALVQELGGRPELAKHLSTRGVKSTKKNAARTYKRAVARHGFALML